MMPETIRERLETLDLQTYNEAKEYAIKQARNLKKNFQTSTFDLNENEEEKNRHGSRKRVMRKKTTNIIPGRTCWLGWEKGQARATEAPTRKVARARKAMGGVQGKCHYCGVYGHRISECRKQDADMKGKAKARIQRRTWDGTPHPRAKVRARARKRLLERREGSLGKGEGSVLDGRRLDLRLQWLLL